jgi:hypothetical protein
MKTRVSLLLFLCTRFLICFLEINNNWMLLSLFMSPFSLEQWSELGIHVAS